MDTPAASLTIDRQQSLADWHSAVKTTILPFGVVVLAATMVLAWAFGRLPYFLNAYLIAFMFCLSISLGSLFFVLAAYVTRASWSVVVRRLAEISAMGVTPLAILFLVILVPVLMGNHTLFRWTDPSYVQDNPMVAKKAAYLNTTWFTIRALGYFAVWAILARFFFRNSLEQDKTGDPSLTLKAERVGAVGAFFFALALTFASFDWLMSLDANWYSTIFGVWYFATSAVACFAFLIIVVMTLQARGFLQNVVTVDHFHDLGKLMFGFTCFWAYISFSQYFLQWYANIPEETQWYLLRQGGADPDAPNGWQYVALAVIALGFAIPFVGLMARGVKRHRTALFFWACWLLAFRVLDIYFVVRPEYDRELGPTFGLIDVGCLVGLICVYLGSLFRIAANHPIVAGRDPRLAESFVAKNLI